MSNALLEVQGLKTYFPIIRHHINGIKPFSGKPINNTFVYEMFKCSGLVIRFNFIFFYVCIQIALNNLIHLLPPKTLFSTWTNFISTNWVKSICMKIALPFLMRPLYH